MWSISGGGFGVDGILPDAIPLLVANPKHFELIVRGVDAWNRARRSDSELSLDRRDGGVVAHLESADLSAARFCCSNLNGVDFSGVDLSYSDLSGAKLRKANLRHANLSRANVIGTDLAGTDLTDANLTGANFTGANLFAVRLIRAKLTGTRLRSANLSHADLSEASFQAALLAETLFANTALATATGLDTCLHSEPSALDYRTLIRSGSLPLAFLRGCGFPDDLITYLPMLLNQTNESYSCFISYSMKDQEFADRLYADLQNKGVRCWFARHDIQGGKKIYEQIDEAISIYDRLLLILSRDSMSSEWVKTEIGKARRRELREKRQILFPVRLVDFQTLRKWECFDADTGKDSAQEIREYYVPDFSNWKNQECYAEEFERLVRDLKAKPTLT